MKNLEMGIIKNGKGMSQGSGLYEQWEYEEKIRRLDKPLFVF